MEFNLDVKDIITLRYFDDFRNSGRMNYEVIEGVKYCWISYQNIEDELPYQKIVKQEEGKNNNPYENKKAIDIIKI